MEEDSEDSLNPLETLFCEKDQSTECFYFRKITIINVNGKTEIIYLYNFNNEIDIVSKLMINETIDISSISIDTSPLKIAIISIGLYLLIIFL